MLLSILFEDVLLLLLGVTRTSRAVLIIVFFEDVLLLLLGVTRTSRALLVSVLFADVLFLLLGESTTRFDPGRSVGNVDVMRVHGAW